MSRRTARMARARSSEDRVLLLVLIAFLAIAVVTAVLAFIWARSFFAAGSPIPPPGANSGQYSGTNSGKGAADNSKVPVPTGPLQRQDYPTPVPWDGSSRVTVLVMGLDYRDWSEGNDVPRTDSMILFSIDPISKTAGMLSIPRDMWVNVPEGMGYNKINTAYRWGEIYKLPGGGPGLAMKTVEEFLGVPVDYYALIDFNSFVKFIDELGGLDMKIREEITVDPIGPGNTRTLEPGTQTLDGATVLAYARQRYTENDDFDRARRQQEVIMAIRNQVINLKMLPTLVTKAPRLYQDIAAGISTNLTLDQVVRLSLLASQIDEKNIQKGVIGPPDQVEISTNPEDGQSILIPIPDKIRILRDQIFATGGPVAPHAVQTAEGEGDPAELMKAEKARVILKNGTSIAGLASKASELLRPQGINITGEDNADKPCPVTTLKDFTGKPYTIRFLRKQLNVPDSRVINSFDPKAQADIEICLGSDWASQQK